MIDALVSTQWLAAELGAPDLRVLDASYHLAPEGRDARAEHEAAHLPGALFMDLAAFADRDTDLPMMLPPPDRVAAQLGALGVSERDRIVLYDDSALHSSARAWWMLRQVGARDVAILDGGLAKWRAERRPLASDTEVRPPAHFTAHADGAALRTLDQMRINLAQPKEQVLDARSLPRFSGEEPDPRPHIVTGHIPGSRHLHYADLFEADGTWKQGEALRAAFAAAGADLSRPLVATCNSGVTAAVLAFGAHLLGAEAAIYDGSWSEWGAHPDTPKAKGPPA